MDEYYIEILQSEYRYAFTTLDRVCFSKEEIKSIEAVNRIIDNYGVKGFINARTQGNATINILKMADDYYYVSKNGPYYKCDQFDGLIRCLKDITD